MPEYSSIITLFHQFIGEMGFFYFPVELPQEWANAKVREIHTGHLHREDGKDVFGMMVRTLATRNKTDQWHRDNGFIGNHKRFMLFQYNEEEFEAIYYV